MDLNSLETRNFLDHTEKYESTFKAYLHVKSFRSKSLSCLDVKESNKKSLEKDDVNSNSSQFMITNFKNSESQNQTNKLNKTLVNRQFYQNGTQIRNVDEIERLTDENIVSDDGNEERNNDKEVELDKNNGNGLLWKKYLFGGDMESLRLFYCNNWVSIFIILFDCFLKFNYVQKKI